MDGTEKVSEHWGKPRSDIGERNHWLNHPLTRAHINIRTTGNHVKDVLTLWRDEFIDQPLENVLSIGCGFGIFERGLVMLGLARNILGIDLSASAIESAIASAKDEGMSGQIRYRVADLNEFVPEPGTYDAIFAVSAVHHIEKLEDFFLNCRLALKPGGRLFLDEYIGPSRFHLSDAALDAMNSIFAILPERYRMMMELDPPTPRERMYRPTLEWFETNDPSESVRSADIMRTLKEQFEVVDFRPYGGGISHLFFSGIAANFDEANEDHRTIMLLILLIESLLEKHKIIDTDFAAMVARPKVTHP